MSSRFVLAFLLLFVGIVASRDAKKKARKEFHFVDAIKEKVISEGHHINATVMHVRAIGAKGSVSYTIMEPNSPFEIDERGHIWLMKKLNGTKNPICQLTIKAVDSRNPNKPVYAKVRFDIMVKNHAPKLDISKNEVYICAVAENSRQVQVLPPIRIIDEDQGDLGRLKSIKVQQPGIPFRFDVNKDGGVEVTATEDLDAEKTSIYEFNIVAVDGGDKESPQAGVTCKVVDVNEFSPVFESDVYIGDVVREKVYPNILKVAATDKDIGDENGKVCKYEIITKDVPFKMSDSGVLSLDKPLDDKAPNYCTFQVAAVDCGGRSSVMPTNITVYINDRCKIELKKPDFEEITIPQCIGKALVGPDISIVPSKGCKGKTDFSFSAMIHLETKAGMSCDRQQYEASSMYKLCGTSNFIDILPKPSVNKKWTSKLKRGGDGFVFNGSNTVEVPSKVITGEFSEHFTVSTWIKTGLQKGKQVIMANTDKTAHNRMHFALIKNWNRLIVVHRLTPLPGREDDYCNSDFHYKPNIFDQKWHHLTVVVDGCNVKLYVDGEHQPAKIVDSNYRMHKSKIKPGLYVGAHWLGREQTFTQYFQGMLSGMAINLNKPASQQTIRCMMGCREHINIDAPLPSGFRSELVGFNKMKIYGKGSPKDFENILQNIEYQNELFTPREGKRKIRVTITEKTTNMKDKFMVNVNMDLNKKPRIAVKGCKDERVQKGRLHQMGVPLCSNLEIVYDGCEPRMNSPVNTVKLLDRAVIKVSPPLKKGESLKLPKQKGSKVSIVEDVELESYSDKNGLYISGVANFKTYERLLREVVYQNLNPDNKLRHRFYIYVSDQSGRFMSDKEVINLSILKPKFHEAIRLRPFNLEAVKESLSAEELPGAVTIEKVAVKNTVSSGLLAAIIVCSVSVFVFLIVLGVYRLRRNANVLEVEATAGEKEEMYWDDTGLGGVRITVNPLQKFQELDLNEDKDSENNSDDEDNQEAKQSLEWDEGAL